MSKMKYWDGTSWIPLDAQSTATIIVAASDSKYKGRADYVVPAGATNAEVTLQSAISALPTMGGRIVLLDGTFTVSGAINVPSNVTIEGQGNATVIKIADGISTSFSVITNSDSTNGNSNIIVKSLRIDGNKTNTSGSTSGVKLSKCTKSQVVECTIENLRNNGIWLSSTCTNVIIARNIVNSVIAEGISFLSSTDCLISNNVVLASGSHGISILGSNNNIVGNLSKLNTGSGIYIAGSSSRNNTVTGNTVASNTIHGIYVYNSSNYNNIYANTSITNGQNGILIAANCAHNSIIGNVCVENSQTITAGYDNIQIAGNTCNVQQNTCRAGATSNKPKYGINVVTGATGNLVTNNDLTTGGATGAFSDVGTGTITTAGNKLA